ncbi:MAG: hypothetical protein HYX20_02040 [Candidatus Yanofskybacteria bacterium]|nr:hypothetical protein [Candidatus Yanofskybacteria bacterium]
MEKLTDGKCVVCGGVIAELIEREFDSTTGSLIYGPGSKNQYKNVSKGFHCHNCGIKYQFIPKPG